MDESGRPITKFHKGDTCKIFGTGNDAVGSFNKALDLQGCPMTPLECIVLAQAISPNFGRRFDWYSRKSGELIQNIDLTDRQRQKILDRIYTRLELKAGKEVIRVTNEPN
ncbi:hypothetical protein D3C78_1712250 [compost metagenome]